MDYLFYPLFHSFESFYHQYLLMVFYWNLSDSKSPQVSGTLLSILSDLSNTGWPLLVLWFQSLPVSWPILWGSFQVHQLQLVSPSPSCSIASSALLQNPVIYHFFHLLLILLGGLLGQPSPLFGRFSFFPLSLGLVVWLRLDDPTYYYYYYYCYLLYF